MSDNTDPSMPEWMTPDEWDALPLVKATPTQRRRGRIELGGREYLAIQPKSLAGVALAKDLTLLEDLAVTAVTPADRDRAFNIVRTYAQMFFDVTGHDETVDAVDCPCTACSIYVRLLDPGDPLDTDEIADGMSQLAELWGITRSRAERRAAARQARQG